MQNRSQDLWPEDIGKPIDLPTPVSLLKEQAALLGDKTHNIVEAEVKTEIGHDSSIRHNFYLVAPALNHYRYLLFWVRYQPTNFYPVDIASDSPNAPATANSEEDLKEALKTLFSSERTRRIIQSLIAQSR